MKRLFNKNEKGFTLAELLIVVAIIAVLVAVAIPVFSAQLHKSRRATDEANARSLYANLQADYLTNATNTTDYEAASWSDDLATGTTIEGQGSTFDLQDGETVKLNDDDSTITLYLDPAEGWGVTFQCDEYDEEAISWGVQE